MAYRSLPLCLLLLGVAATAALAQTATNAPAAAVSPSQSFIDAGYAAARQGDIPGAIKAFRDATQADPGNPIAYCELGRALAYQSRLDEAIVAFDKGISLNPKLAGAYYERGTAKARKNNLDGALADFTQAITLAPDFSRAYYNRGHVKYFKGDLPGAQSDLDQAIKLSPDDPLPYYIRGLVEQAQGNTETARADFTKAAAGFPEAAFWLWLLDMQSGDRDGARAHLQQAAANPKLVPSGKWPAPLADFLLGNITQEKLIAKARDVNESDKNEECEAWFYAGMVKLMSSDKVSAIECFGQAISTGSLSSEELIESRRQAAKLKTP